MHLAKTQISLDVGPSDQSLRCPHEETFVSSATHWAHCEDSDQTGRMPRLIWVFAGRTVVLLVLSWGGSNILFIFRIFDKDKSGRLNKRELAYALRTLGEQLSEEEVDDLFKTLDTNKDGELDYIGK